MSDEFEDEQAEAADRRRAFRRQRAESNAQLNRQATESRYVKMLLTSCNLGKYERTICQRSKDAGGQFQLTFSCFTDEFGSFPMQLELFTASEPLHLSDRMGLPSLLLKFRETPFYEAYTELWRRSRRSRDGRPCGLVAPFKGLDYGLLLHPGRGLPDVAATSLCFRHPSPRELDEPSRVYMMPFRVAARAWAAEWEPE